MSSFTDNLIVEKINPREWKTWRAFDYHIGELGDNKVVHVPEGFITDFASVPRAFWIFLPPDGIYTQSAVLHDYLYNTKMFPRKECDRLFLEAMKVLKVGKFTRGTMYLAVRWFGWKPWNEKNITNDKALKPIFDNTGKCLGCGKQGKLATGIGYYCPNKRCKN